VLHREIGAREFEIRGVVQGVGFRPFVYRLANRLGLHGWVLNGESGVQVHVEGAPAELDAFAQAVVIEAPPAARIASVATVAAPLEGYDAFAIRESGREGPVTVRMTPDLPVCAACLRELFDPENRRFRYPYITCTDCGPRYSIMTGLPYDRPFTTMSAWPLCPACEREYNDPGDRRFHAQPLACPACGPTYALRGVPGRAREWDAIEAAAALLRDGKIIAVKGIGGYHLACDAMNAGTVAALRARKYRKERPFALMPRDLATARALVDLSAEAEALLTSSARPVVLAPSRVTLDGVAPGNSDLGVMLPYAPLQYLLFAAGAPGVLVMTSANRSGEPMAFDDADAEATLAGIADAFLIGERPIARRLDDSVARSSISGTTVVRRARGMAPLAVATLPATQPILAVGGELKNAPVLVVDGQVFAGQHIGDLEHLPCRDALAETVRDLCAIYGMREDALLIAHDAHPQYASTAFALSLGGPSVAVQHHRAHVASVLAEHGAWETEIVGVAFDGTGYGDDGTIWGGEVFTGSIASGLVRTAHLRSARLPGGDAAARFPVQAAAGFLFDLDDVPDVMRPPFDFPPRYRLAREMIAKNVRTFSTTSVGRLFDAAAALLGFTREITFDGQAAMWLEHHAAGGDDSCGPYAFPLHGGELDYRPLLTSMLADRLRGRDPRAIARAFQTALVAAIAAVRSEFGSNRPLVASGGVFANRSVVEGLSERLGNGLWINHIVPPNDGGLSLGQATLAAMSS
jgi:hydrogenase maturation protein HypF